MHPWTSWKESRWRISPIMDQQLSCTSKKSSRHLDPSKTVNASWISCYLYLFKNLTPVITISNNRKDYNKILNFACCSYNAMQESSVRADSHACRHMNNLFFELLVIKNLLPLGNRSKPVLRPMWFSIEYDTLTLRGAAGTLVGQLYTSCIYCFDGPKYLICDIGMNFYI